MNERFKLVRETLKQKTGDFAKYLDIPQSYVSGIENGSKEVSKNVMQKLIEKCNVNINWLITGRDEMFLSEKKSKFTNSFNENHIEYNQKQSQESVKMTYKKEALMYMSQLLAESQKEITTLKQKIDLLTGIVQSGITDE